MEKITRNIQIIAISALLIGVIFLITNTIIVNRKISAIKEQLVHVGEEIDETNVGIKRILNRPSLSFQLNSEKNPKIEISELEYDFGKIKKSDGVISKKFMLSNNGQGKLIIGDISTSCGCTSTQADKKEAAQGEKINVEVKFDPNFHEEPKGRFSRSIFIPTNDPFNSEIELKIFVEILEN